MVMVGLYYWKNFGRIYYLVKIYIASNDYNI